MDGWGERLAPHIFCAGAASFAPLDPRKRKLPMTIAEQIQKDMVNAMRAREELRLSTLRMAKAALQLKAVDKRAPLEDHETLQVLTTLIKQRRDSIEQFTKGGRQEMADKEAKEIVILEAYMPQSAGEGEVVEVVQATIAEMGNPSIKDMGTVMKNVMAKFAASKIRVEGKMVSEAVKRELSNRPT